MSAKVRPPFEEGRIGLTLAEPPLVTLTTPERLIGAVKRRWRLLALALLAGTFGGVIAGRMLPAWYDSTATFAVIPVDDPTAPIQGASESAGAALPLFSYVLVSHRVLDDVVQQLQLQRAYGKSSPYEARKELLRHVAVSTDRKANVVVLDVEDRQPVRAQKIASTLGDVGRAVNTEIWSARASEHRKKLEARLAEVSKSLAAAEEAMRQFREREHVVDLAEQMKASVAEAAFLERVKNEKRMKLRFDQSFAGAESPEVRRGQLETGGTNAALQGLVHGGAGAGPLLALDRLPRLEQEHARLKRDIDVNSSTYDLLSRQVEQLRAVEARPGGRAELVDAPVEPKDRTRPSRIALALEGALIGFFVGLLLVVWSGSQFIALPPKLSPLRDFSR